MKMVVGLGNPGRSYRFTRHNLGFIVIDALAEKYKVQFDKKDYDARWGKAVFAGKMAVLAKPFTYMNLSGGAVRELVKKFRIKLENLLVVVDDVNLSWGRLRLRSFGSAGGHNGLKSIIENLGSNEFSRLRLGISGSSGKRLTNYVLAEFNQSQKKELPVLVNYGVEAIEVFVVKGIGAAMNRFNKGNVLTEDR